MRSHCLGSCARTLGSRQIADPGAARWLTAGEAKAAQILRFGSAAEQGHLRPAQHGAASGNGRSLRCSARIRHGQPHVAAMNHVQPLTPAASGNRNPDLLQAVVGQFLAGSRAGGPGYGPRGRRRALAVFKTRSATLLTCGYLVTARILDMYSARLHDVISLVARGLHSFVVSSRRLGGAAQLREPDAEVGQRSGR